MHFAAETVVHYAPVYSPMGDFRLSPTYDLLNSRIHKEDKDFALDDGLLPGNLAEGNVRQQFQTLAHHAGLSEKQEHDVFMTLTSETAGVSSLVKASFLSEKIQRNYWQAYQTRLKKLTQS